nr:Major sperm protein domain containing protein [Haemonchus contortus]
MGEGNEGEDKGKPGEQLKEAEPKSKIVLSVHTPPPAKEKEPPKTDQGPIVFDKNVCPKPTPRLVIFKVTQEKKPVWSEINVQNPSNNQKTFKVKCTSAEFFRVQPPLGFVKAKETAKIRLWFQNANGIPTDGKRHYFAIYYMDAQEGKTVKDLWTKNAKHEGISRVNVQFEKVPAADGGGETKK